LGLAAFLFFSNVGSPASSGTPAAFARTASAISFSFALLRFSSAKRFARLAAAFSFLRLVA
jgi:hypothetical protein